jgi:hypothetical protein
MMPGCTFLCGSPPPLLVIARVVEDPEFSAKMLPMPSARKRPLPEAVNIE